MTSYLVVAGGLLLAVACAATWFLWPQIVSELVRMAVKAVLANSKGLETPDEMRRRVREGRERKDRGR